MKNRVREMREQMGVTQAELGRLAGVSRQAVNAIERGKYVPSIRLAYALSRIFQCSIEELFLFEEGGENEKE